ncbi:MAG: glycosyltransferase family 4 protein [Anaerolineae bacterium]
MKVAFTTLFKEGLGGGEGRVAHELAHQFARQHDVLLICPAEKTGLYAQDGLQIFGVQSAGEGEFLMPALTGKTVSTLIDTLDAFEPVIVHAHEPALLGLIAQVWARMRLVPFVHTSHVLPHKILNFGTADALDLKLLRSSFGETVTQQILSNFYENCDAVIALNKYAVDAIRAFGYTGRVFVIPNGRDLTPYHACTYADPATSPKTLTFTGYLSERKNQIYLLEVMQHLPADYHLQLIGKALKPGYDECLKRFCAEHGLASRVTFTGQVPYHTIRRYLEKTHFFVSASKMEVQSLSVIEALASGTPVIGLSNETIDELVDDKVGCCLPQDAPPEAFAACIERLATLAPDAYRRLCSEAQARVANLDWTNVVPQTVQAYHTLIREKRPFLEEELKKERRHLRELVSFLPAGEIRETLLDKVGAWKQPARGPLRRFTPAMKIRALRRVPGSTWILSGLTILVSVIGYLIMKYFKPLAGSTDKKEASSP